MSTLSRREFFKVALLSAMGTTVAATAGAVYAMKIEPNMIDVAQVPLILPRLSPAFDGYRLVQISDIHMGTWMTPDRLMKVIDLVNEQNPDLIAITGDFVTEGDVSKQLTALQELLPQLQAVDGTVAILGNHDHWTDPRAIKQMIHNSGLIDLNNSVYTLQRGDEMLNIAGVDDYWERQDDLDGVISRLPDDESAAILLVHEPDYADISAQTDRFDLQISGHSHGGQVILPFLGPPQLPALAHKYPVGQYKIGNMIQYTNRGVGMIAPTVRLNCRPEITVFTLHSRSEL